MAKLKFAVPLFIFFSSSMLWANDVEFSRRQCENIVTYCTCNDSYSSNSYHVSLVAWNVDTEKEKRKWIGKGSYGGSGAEQSCLAELESFAICR